MAILEPTAKADTLKMMKKLHPQENRVSLIEQMKKIVKESEKDK